MIIVIILFVLGLVGVTVVLLQRNQDPRGSSGKDYFTHTLGIGAAEPPAAKDEPPAAKPVKPRQRP